MFFGEIPVRVAFKKVKQAKLSFQGEELHMILPFGAEPAILLERHRGWVIKRMQLIKQAKDIAQLLILANRNEDELRSMLSYLLDVFSSRLGVCVKKFSVRNMKNKWGSCSSKGYLTFNSKMRFLPNRLIEYIAYHEVAHLVEPLHNSRFRKIIEGKFPDALSLESELFAYWLKIEADTELNSVPQL